MQPASFILIVTRRRFDMCNHFTFIDVCVGLTLWSTLCSVLQVLGIQPVVTDHAQQTNRNEISTLADWFRMKKTTSSRNDWKFTSLHDSRAMASTVEFSAIFGKGRIQVVLCEVRRIRLPFYCQFPKWRTFLGIFVVQGIF